MAVLSFPARLECERANPVDSDEHMARHDPPPPRLLELFAQHFDSADREYLVVAGFDRRGCLTAFAEVCGHASRVDNVLTAVRQALAPPSTTSLIMAHNHVYGGTEPSQADIEATRQIERLARLAGVRLIDHIILCGHHYTSFAARGLI